MAVCIRPTEMTVPELETAMRHLEIPVIPRTFNDMIVMDVRTIDEDRMKIVTEELKEIFINYDTDSGNEKHETHYYRNGRSY